MATNYPQDNDSLRGKDKSIYRNEFEHLDKLGCGSFGVVFRAKNILDNMEYAVKCIQLKNESEQKTTEREFTTLAQFDQCHHIVGYKRVWRETVKFDDQLKLNAEIGIYNLTQTGPMVHFCYIQMELCRESLENWLENKPDRDKVESLKIFKRVMKGLTFIHEKKVVHRDLKPGNILFAKTNDDLRVRIADFGLSRKVEGSSATNAGTPLYMAPETLFGKFDLKSDIYSAAFILLELLYKCSGDQKKCILYNARQNQFPPEFENTMKFAVPTLNKMMSSTVSDRPSSDELLQILKMNPDWIDELQSAVGRLRVEHPSEEEHSNWEDFSSKEVWKFTSECSSEQHSLQRVGRFTADTILPWDGKEASSWTAFPAAASSNTRWNVMLGRQSNDDFVLAVRCTFLDAQFRAADVRVVAVVEGAPQVWGEVAAVVQPSDTNGLIFSNKLKDCPIVRPLKVRVTAQWTDLEHLLPTPDLWKDNAAYIHCTWELTGWKVVTPTAEIWDLWSEPFGQSGVLWRIQVRNACIDGQRNLQVCVWLQHLISSVEWSGMRWKCSLSVWGSNAINEKNMEQNSYCAISSELVEALKHRLDVTVIITVSRTR